MLFLNGSLGGGVLKLVAVGHSLSFLSGAFCRLFRRRFFFGHLPWPFFVVNRGARRFLPPPAIRKTGVPREQRRKALREGGAIEVRERRIHIVDQEALQRAAEEG